MNRDKTEGAGLSDVVSGVGTPGPWLELLLAFGKKYLEGVTGYLLAALALGSVAKQVLGQQIEYLWSESSLLVKILIILAPLIPAGIKFVLELINKRRIRHLENFAVHSQEYKPGYFRLEPYTRADYDKFLRDDQTHVRVFQWLVQQDGSKLCYLTGVSGSGKTSLLQAYVLPSLDSSWQVLSIRAWQVWEEDLKAEITRAGLPNYAYGADFPARGWFEELVGCLRQKGIGKVLLVVDQFEQTMIVIDSEARADRSSSRETEVVERLVDLIKDLGKRPIEGLHVLLSMRTDYEENIVRRFQLPTAISGINRVTVGLFELGAAELFLKRSGLEIPQKQVHALLSGAELIDDRPGLYRPVILNIIGLQMTRSKGVLPCPPEVVVYHYLFESLSRRQVRQRVDAVLPSLKSSEGTVVAVTISELSHRTKISAGELKGMFKSLREDGLVRPLDHLEETWQISHDFIARQLDAILKDLRKGWWWRVAKWSAPAVLVCLVMFTFGIPAWARFRAVEELRKSGALITSPDGLEWVEIRAERLGDLIGATRLAGVRNLRIEGGKVDALAALEKLPYLVDLEIRGVDIGDISSLGRLSDLQRLSLAGSTISDISPLNQLKHLSSLDLTRTAVANLTPLRFLNDLQDLKIASTHVEDISPLGDLRALRELDISNTRIANLWPLASCSSLRSLVASRSAVIDLEPLAQITSLEILDLSATPISDLGALRGMPRLSRLYMAQTRVRNLAVLSRSSRLEVLDLEMTPVDDLRPIGGLLGLTDLNLARTGIRTIEPLSGNENLRRLSLSGTEVPSIEPIRKLKSLKKLDLSRTKVRDLTPVVDLDGLEYLDLSFSGHGKFEPPPQLPKLQVFVFENIVRNCE